MLAAALATAAAAAEASSEEELTTLTDYLQKHGEKEIIRFLQRYAGTETLIR